MNPKTYLSLSQAAKQTRKSKGTIYNALKSGKLSYVEKTSNGYKIDPAELFRVFNMNPNKIERSEQPEPPSLNNNERIQELEKEVTRMSVEISGLKTERNIWKEQSDKWEKQAEQLGEQAKRLALTYQPSQQAEQQPGIVGFLRPQEWALVALSAAIIIGAAILKA